MILLALRYGKQKNIEMQKESIVLDGTYYDLKDAVARLKKVMSRQNYAFAEIEK